MYDVGHEGEVDYLWIPETPDQMLDIEFIGDSPFNESRLTATHKGDCVGAIVIANPQTKQSFNYTLASDGIRFDAEPEIIVDGGGGGEPPDKKPGKAAQRKHKKKSVKKSVKKKSATRKAAKKR